MTTLLVPVGHVIEASRAVGRVAALADPVGDRVVVLHVHDSAAGGRQQEPDRDCIAEIVARSLRRAGVQAQCRTVTGDVSDLAQEIARVAAEVQADVVVVGDAPTWMSVHQGVRAQLERLLPRTRVVPVRAPV